MKQLREGISTGSCMTAGALASVIWQTSGMCPEWVEIQAPIGKKLKIAIQTLDYGVCSVIKDGGDDPDVTDGCEIITKVDLQKDGQENVSFEAGEGVGTITEPGLKLPPGEPAINPVPRQMVIEHVKPYLDGNSAHITVMVPGGEEIAKKTFNPRLGVIGGISILGTTGIVRPMSEEAVKDSLALELSVLYEKGHRQVVFVTGNQGRKMLEQTFGTLNPIVMIGNHIGFMIERATELGFQSVLIGGQYGKLMKLAGGIFHTHSHIADGKMEILCTHAALHGVNTEMIQSIYNCKTAKEADALLKKYQLEYLWQDLVEKAEEKVVQCGRNQLTVGILFFDNEGNIKAQSHHVRDVLGEVAKTR